MALKKIRLHHPGYWGIPPTVLREIKILKQLQHKNLVKMFEVVSSKGVEELDWEDEREDEKRKKAKQQQQQQQQAAAATTTVASSDGKSSSIDNNKNYNNSTPILNSEDNSKKKDTTSNTTNITSTKKKKNKDPMSDIEKLRESYKGNLFLSLEYISHDLTGLLDMAYKFSEVQVKCIASQLLSVLEFMHSRNFVHRDLKVCYILLLSLSYFSINIIVQPSWSSLYSLHLLLSLSHTTYTPHIQTSNILITDNFELKLADFGLARCLESSFMGRLFEGEGYSSGEGEFTNKVITLWYRPPELLLGETRYGCAVDIWSAGCIFAEIILGRPIFTGKTEMDQLKLIFDLIGTPTDRSWEGFRELKLIRTGEFSIEKARKPRLREKYGEKIKPSSALGLLEKLLELDPKKRCTASRALNHRYFQASPVAPDDPKELGKIDLGGDGSGYHEFKTKKRRREAKGVAKMAEDEAKRQGLSVEKQKEAFDVAYREHLQKGASEDKKKVEEEKQKQEKQHEKSKREQDQKGGRKDKPPQTETRDKQQQQQQSRPPPRNMMNQPPPSNMGNRPRDMPHFPRDAGNRDMPPQRDFNRDMPHPPHEMMMGRGPRDMPHPGDIGRGPPRDMPHPHDMGRGPRDNMPHPFDMGRGPPRDMGRGHPNNNDRADQGGPWNNNMNMGRGDGRRMPGRMEDNWGPPPPHLRDQRMHPDQQFRRDQFGPPNDQFYGPPRRPNNGEGHYGPMGGGHPNDNPRRGPPDGNFFDDRGRGPNRNYNDQPQFNREEEFRSRRQQNDDVNERRRERSSERARDGSDANEPRSSRGADRNRDDHPKNGDDKKDDEDERRRSRSPNRSERRRSRDSSRDKDRKRGHRRSHRDDDDRRHRQEKERKDRKSERDDDDQDRKERKRSKESDRGGGSRKRHKRSRQDKDSRRRSDDRSRDRSERNDRRSDGRSDRDRPSFTPPAGRYDQYGNPIGDRGQGRRDHCDESRDGRYGPASGSQNTRPPMGRDGRQDDRYHDRRR